MGVEVEVEVEVAAALALCPACPTRSHSWAARPVSSLALLVSFCPSLL